MSASNDSRAKELLVLAKGLTSNRTAKMHIQEALNALSGSSSSKSGGGGVVLYVPNKWRSDYPESIKTIYPFSKVVDDVSNNPEKDFEGATHVVFLVHHSGRMQSNLNWRALQGVMDLNIPVLIVPMALGVESKYVKHETEEAITERIRNPSRYDVIKEDINYIGGKYTKSGDEERLRSAITDFVEETAASTKYDYNV